MGGEFQAIKFSSSCDYDENDQKIISLFTTIALMPTNANGSGIYY